ncbi:MAG: biopolymer transporter ExbD [Phycisphaerales bacterium]|nr:biopolymer transporter ExbD [Phycisphaerales bacterium]
MISVDLTSMIDVVFQLIIFFIFTSHFGELRRTEIDLPREKGGQQEVQQQPAMIIDIQRSGVFFVESRETSLAEIERLARNGLAISDSGGPKFDVLVRPDQHAAAMHLDRLLVRLSSLGVTSWKIGTVVPDGGGSQ